MAESDLYAPVKRYLEAQGFTVKGEITGAEISEAVLDRVFARFCIGE